MSMHEDQLSVDVSTVRALVDEQFPRWHGLRIREVDSPGTVNAIFRIGDDLAARFPIRAADPDAVREWQKEEEASTREFAQAVNVQTPLVVDRGEPGHGYPLPWTVQTWVHGGDATTVDTSANVSLATELVVLISSLRSAPTHGRVFAPGGRGGELSTHDDWMDECFATWSGTLNVAILRDLWSSMRRLPRLPVHDVMSHRDLIPGNVVLGNGRLVGVLDAGGYGPADPALDLIAAWHFFDEPARSVMREGLACSELEWARGRAWAFEQAVGAAWYYGDTNAPMYDMGVRTLTRIVADEERHGS